MRSVVVLALVAASASGCLAHERPSEVDAAITPPAPDAFVGRDATVVRSDAFANDAFANDAFVPECLGVWHSLPAADQEVSLVAAACAPGAPECVTIDVTGRDALDDPESICAGPNSAQGTRVRFERCAAGSVRTILRVTILATSSPSGGWLTYPSDGACTGATLATNVGDVIEVAGTDHLDSGDDAFGFFGRGARYRVEACAIRSCP